MSLQELQDQIDALQVTLKEQQEILQNKSAQQVQFENSSVCRVSAKLPPFWPDKPAVWFSQVESQFVLANISQDETKFHHVVANLDSRYASEVDDIIVNPPVTGKYDTIKKELIHRLSLSEEQRVRQLLGREELGDRKPSQFLRHLKSLAGSIELKDSLLRSLWIQRLPPHVQAILQAQVTLSPEEMANLADRIVEIPLFQTPSAVNSINSSNEKTTLSELSAQVQDLSRIVKEMQSHLEYRKKIDPKRYRSRSRNRTYQSETSQRQQQTFSDDNSLCFYHKRFHERARTCKPPCAFQENNSGSH